MRPAAIRLWTRFVAYAAGACAVLLLARAAPPGPSVPAAAAVAAGLAAGILCFVAVWRRRPGLRVSRARVQPFALLAAWTTVQAASEEIIWRGFVLATLAHSIGLAPAFVVATVGFAVTHAARQGRRGVVVHVVTGAVFGGVFVVTGSIAAAAATHVAYNALVLLTREERRVLPRPAAPLVARAAPAAAELCGVHRSFGDAPALRGLDLAIEPGELFALLGPNGAGKTTALAILLGLRRADRGSARVFGLDPRLPSARASLGATLQETAFPATATARELVELVRAHYPAPVATDELLDRFMLTELQRRQMGNLSVGERRRLSVALAFAGNPRIVFLDEPTTGLDVESRRHVWDAILDFSEAGGTIVLSTHYLEEAERVASRVLVLAEGVAIAEGTVPEIKQRAGLKRIRLEVDDLPPLPDVERTTREGRVRTLYTSDADSVVRALVAHDVRFSGIEVLPATLEEAFFAMTTRAS